MRDSGLSQRSAARLTGRVNKRSGLIRSICHVIVVLQVIVIVVMVIVGMLVNGLICLICMVLDDVHLVCCAVAGLVLQIWTVHGGRVRWLVWGLVAMHWVREDGRRGCN